MYKTWETHKANLDKIKPDNITYLGFVGEWQGVKTPVLFNCSIHGDFTGTSIRSHQGMFHKGKPVCPGCKTDISGRKLRTPEEVLAEVIAKAPPTITILGFVGEYVSLSKTKLKIVCDKHGEYTSTTCTNFLSHNKFCPKCARDRITAASTLEDSYHTEKFLASGKFAKGTIFTRASNTKTKWIVTCGVCSKDEYTRAGLCTGDFLCSGYELAKGRLSCRCSSCYRWTDAQWIYRAKKSCESKNLKFIEIRKHTDQITNRAKIFYECPLHGKGSSELSLFTDLSRANGRGAGCAQCHGLNHNQTECYINMVGDRFDWGFIKFGISVNSNTRVKVQSKALPDYQIAPYAVWVFDSTQNCKAAEREVLNTLPCGALTKLQMPDGYTETLSAVFIDKVIAIFEKHGGTLKPVSLARPKRKRMRDNG